MKYSNAGIWWLLCLLIQVGGSVQAGPGVDPRPGELSCPGLCLEPAVRDRGGCRLLQKKAFVPSAALPRRLQAEVLVAVEDDPQAHKLLSELTNYTMWHEWAASLCWWALCLLLSSCGASACKKKTICRPPPGGRPGCGGGLPAKK